MHDGTLNNIYRDHRAKVSDKWALYISEYDRLFYGLRDREVGKELVRADLTVAFQELELGANLRVPVTSLDQGLQATVAYFRRVLEVSG